MDFHFVVVDLLLKNEIISIFSQGVDSDFTGMQINMQATNLYFYWGLYLHQSRGVANHHGVHLDQQLQSRGVGLRMEFVEIVETRQQPRWARWEYWNLQHGIVHGAVLCKIKFAYLFIYLCIYLINMLAYVTSKSTNGSPKSISDTEIREM